MFKSLTNTFRIQEYISSCIFFISLNKNPITKENSILTFSDILDQVVWH